MQTSQELNDKVKIFRLASARQRLIAAFIFLGVAGLFALFWLAANDKINIGLLLDPCGLKQRTGWPCPTCGFTTSAIAFVRGRIFEAFYIQPVAALFCGILGVLGFSAFIVAVFGVYCGFLERLFAKVKVIYLILAFVVIIAIGWSVTLLRAMAEGN